MQPIYDTACIEATWKLIVAALDARRRCLSEAISAATEKQALGYDIAIRRADISRALMGCTSPIAGDA